MKINRMIVTDHPTAKGIVQVSNPPLPTLLSLHGSESSTDPAWTVKCPDRLVLHFDDVIVHLPQHGYVAASLEQVRAIVDFAKLSRSYATWLVHCAAGISRSVAAAVVVQAAVASKHETDPRKVSRLAVRGVRRALMETRESGWRVVGERPNARVVLLGELVLGLDGHLERAVAEHWPQLATDGDFDRARAGL